MEFYQHFDGEVRVSFSGGKDSTVLLDIVRGIYPDTPADFYNTGVEFPEIVEFVKTVPNVNILRPEKSFRQCKKEYGYPKLYEYAMKPFAEGGLGYRDVLNWLQENYVENMKLRVKRPDRLLKYFEYKY